MRAATVSQKALAAVARSVGLGRYVLLGKGEIRTRGFNKDSILSDTMEALIGAVYISHGIQVARGFVHWLVDPTLAAAADAGAGLDWKTSLQELAAASGLGPPVYSSESEGPDHARVFTSYIHLDGQLYGTGRGSAKKHAEHAAAKSAYKALAARQEQRLGGVTDDDREGDEDSGEVDDGAAPFAGTQAGVPGGVPGPDSAASHAAALPEPAQ
jgi:ribonuclease-3